MKAIITTIIIILLFGCDSSNQTEEPVIPEIKFQEVYPETTISRDPNGWIDVNGNEVTYTSHDINYSYPRDCEAWYCKKVEHIFENTPWTESRETIYDFYLKVNKYNFEDPPEWIIIFQDWAKVDETDPTGNHPTTTLKHPATLLRVSNMGEIELRENSWQYLYTTADPYDALDPEDRKHNHPEDLLQGSTYFQHGEYIHIELTIYDGDVPETGGSILKVNGQIIVDAYYQTKQTKNRHFTARGLYWTKGYNTRFNLCEEITGISENECKSNSITIKDFKVFERINN